MPALISLVKNTRWTDLSPKHKELREFLEKSISNPEKIIMIKGAFGIGKTNALHYAFHYGWCKLKLPVLFVSLERLYPVLEKFAVEKPDQKIGNVELCEFLETRVLSALEALRNDMPNEDSKTIFFDWADGSLKEFCEGFRPLVFEHFVDNTLKSDEFPNLTPEIIKEAVNSGKRALLIIDEFETKFIRLKEMLDSSSGGELREFFDQIVEQKVSFDLIIGNGPASGYELQSDTSRRTDDAESSRIIPKQVPFPLPNTIKEFLGTEEKGLLNFAWWATRCRPRHLIRLKEAFGDMGSLILPQSYAEFLQNTQFFREPIESSEEGVSPITYVKTDYFNDFPEELKDNFLSQLITNIIPQRISFNDYEKPLRKSKKFLFCAKSTIKITEILIALAADIQNGKLKPRQAEGKFPELDYDLTLRRYFDFLLNSIADNEGRIVLGMVDDLDAARSFSDMLLLPLIHLTTDFIAQYEEESLPTNKQATEFLLNLLNDIKKKRDENDIRSLFPQTYKLFERQDYLEGNGYIQLSLNAMREVFEQPIGEPRLSYQNLNLERELDDVQIDSSIPLIEYNNDGVSLFFVPDLAPSKLLQYLLNLELHYSDCLKEKLHKDAAFITHIIYLGNNADAFSIFRNKIIFENDEESSETASVKLKKFQCQHISEYPLNFPNHTTDFLDSLVKIGMVAAFRGEIRYNDNVLKLTDIVHAIKDPDWSERKETRRTIEHFEKLIFSNNNSEIGSILSKGEELYENKLLEIFPEQSNFHNAISRYIFSDDLFTGKEYGSFTKKIICLFLFESSTIPEGLESVIKEADSIGFNRKYSEKNEKLSFYEFKTFLKDKKDIIKKHHEDFSKEKTIIQNLTSLMRCIIEKPQLQDINDYRDYLTYSDPHFSTSYHKRLGGYGDVNLSEIIYNYEYASGIVIKDENDSSIFAIKAYKEKLSEVRSEINELNSKLQEILKLDDLPFDHHKKIGDYISKLLIPCEKLLGYNNYLSVLLVVSEILFYTEDLITNSTIFVKQLKKINNALEYKKDRYYKDQQTINNHYSNQFYSNILNKVKQFKDISGDYLWNSVVQEIKNIKHYKELFELSLKSRSFTRPMLHEEELSSFLSGVSELEVHFESDRDEFSEHIDEIKSIVKIEDKIRNLLEISEKE
ncbi:MAG: hypothetical protein K9I71_07225 [Ignavibacteriales bacterium]|nr:hypothetical protein [Melioribacteraceae bacterium]MCF8306047.1 hypothetical protein [Ignavibacteriales bacterium]MCF8315898.1 hypothetical protein [Ignavibacteriales bacterium]MCF8437358.1 hypothetical protein [Ignavibacteriales bacterium]